MAIEWIYVAVVGTNIMTGGYDTKEACFGHRDVLEQESKIFGQCVQNVYGGTYGLTTPGTTFSTTAHMCSLMADGHTYCQ